MKPEFKMQVDELLEALEQSKLLECDFTEITHADNSKEFKCSCEGFMRRVADVEKQCDVLLTTLRTIASIAHCGGLADMTESDALIAIRRTTIPHLVTEATKEQYIAAIASVKGGAV